VDYFLSLYILPFGYGEGFCTFFLGVFCMLRILLAGSDSRLLETRAAVLSKTGAAVIYHNRRETLEVLDREAFDLVVLCHSLSESEAAVIVDKVHQRIPGTKILMVTSDLDRYESHKDGKIDATSIPEPGQLVARVKELLQVTPYALAAKRRDGVDHVHLVVD
jgi:DNA-binding response OmpR family regulator